VCGISRHHQLATDHCGQQLHDARLIVEPAHDIKLATKQFVLKSHAVRGVAHRLPEQLFEAIQWLS
jgi:hypothetical protein